MKQMFYYSHQGERTIKKVLSPFLLTMPHRGTGAGKYFVDMAIHIGQEIETELRRQGHGATWLATRLHCDRTNVYNIFRREGVDTILLQRIGAVLHRNFFMLYCPESGAHAENNSTVV